MMEAFKEKDAVVLTTGDALGGREIAIVDAAIKAGVKRFIPSNFGSNSQNQGTLEVEGHTCELGGRDYRWQEDTFKRRIHEGGEASVSSELQRLSHGAYGAGEGSPRDPI